MLSAWPNTVLSNPDKIWQCTWFNTKLIKSTESKSYFSHEEGKLRNLLFPHIFSSSLLLRAKIHSFWSTSLICMNECLQKLACVGNISFLNEKQSLWHSVIHWLGVMWTQHLQVALFHVYLIKYGWLSLPVSAKWHTLLFSKTNPNLYSIIPHLPLKC